MQKSLRALFPIAFLISASFLPAQPIIQSANNTASYDSTAIAQGSMFVIFGSGLGPTPLVSATQLPLPLSLSNTSVSVKSGATTLSCPMFYTSSGQVVAVMPSNTPIGTATVSITYNGKSSGANSATVNVVTSSVGMFTPPATGLGIGIFTDALTGAHITTANPATPGELLTGWATGVGADLAADATVPPTFPNFPGVQVWVGGQTALMSYAGPSGCCVAVDQLNFLVPKQAASGCNIPVVVTSSGTTSNTTTIPIGTAGTPCSDSGPTFPSGVLTGGAAAKPLRVGTVVIAPVASAQPASRQARSVADQLSAALHATVSVDDAERIMRAVESHNTKALKSAMSKYAAQWRALTSGAKTQLANSISPGQAVESLAFFGTVTNESVAESVVGQMLPPSGSCATTPPDLQLGTFGAAAAGLDAGTSVSITGAAGSFSLREKNIGTYQASVENTVTADIPVGTYTISASGGRDIAAFSSTITIPSHPTLTNTASLATIDRSQPVTVTWTGAVSGKSVMVAGSSSNKNTGLPSQIPTTNRGFICIADGGAGSLTIPSYILSAMWPTPDADGRIYITADPRSEEVTIPGLDALWILDLSVNKVAVIYK